jgi:hypothetical protein
MPPPPASLDRALPLRALGGVRGVMGFAHDVPQGVTLLCNGQSPLNVGLVWAKPLPIQLSLGFINYPPLIRKVLKGSALRGLRWVGNSLGLIKPSVASNPSKAGVRRNTFKGGKKSAPLNLFFQPHNRVSKHPFKDPNLKGGLTPYYPPLIIKALKGSALRGLRWVGNSLGLITSIKSRWPNEKEYYFLILNMGHNLPLTLKGYPHTNPPLRGYAPRAMPYGALAPFFLGGGYERGVRAGYGSQTNLSFWYTQNNIKSKFQTAVLLYHKLNNHINLLNFYLIRNQLTFLNHYFINLKQILQKNLRLHLIPFLNRQIDRFLYFLLRIEYINLLEPVINDPLKRVAPMPLRRKIEPVRAIWAHIDISPLALYPLLPAPLIRKALKGSALRGLRGGWYGVRGGLLLSKSWANALIFEGGIARLKNKGLSLNRVTPPMPLRAEPLLKRVGLINTPYYSKSYIYLDIAITYQTNIGGTKGKAHKLNSLNSFLFKKLFDWSKKQHNNNSNSWVRNKYWLFLYGPLYPLLPPPLIRKALKGSALRGLRGGWYGVRAAIKQNIHSNSSYTTPVTQRPLELTTPYKRVTKREARLKGWPSSFMGKAHKPVQSFKFGHKNIYYFCLKKLLTITKQIRTLNLNIKMSKPLDNVVSIHLGALWYPLLFNPLIPPPNKKRGQCPIGHSPWGIAPEGGGWYGVKKGTARQPLVRANSLPLETRTLGRFLNCPMGSILLGTPPPLRALGGVHKESDNLFATFSKIKILLKANPYLKGTHFKRTLFKIKMSKPLTSIKAFNPPGVTMILKSALNTPLPHFQKGCGPLNKGWPTNPLTPGGVPTGTTSLYPPLRPTLVRAEPFRAFLIRGGTGVGVPTGTNPFISHLRPTLVRAEPFRALIRKGGGWYGVTIKGYAPLLRALTPGVKGRWAGIYNFQQKNFSGFAHRTTRGHPYLKVQFKTLYFKAGSIFSLKKTRKGIGGNTIKLKLKQSGVYLKAPREIGGAMPLWADPYLKKRVKIEKVLPFKPKRSLLKTWYLEKYKKKIFYLKKHSNNSIVLNLNCLHHHCHPRGVVDSFTYNVNFKFLSAYLIKFSDSYKCRFITQKPLFNVFAGSKGGGNNTLQNSLLPSLFKLGVAPMPFIEEEKIEPVKAFKMSEPIRQFYNSQELLNLIMGSAHNPSIDVKPLHYNCRTSIKTSFFNFNFKKTHFYFKNHSTKICGVKDNFSFTEILTTNPSNKSFFLYNYLDISTPGLK